MYVCIEKYVCSKQERETEKESDPQPPALAKERENTRTPERERERDRFCWRRLRVQSSPAAPQSSTTPSSAEVA